MLKEECDHSSSEFSAARPTEAWVRVRVRVRVRVGVGVWAQI